MKTITSDKLVTSYDRRNQIHLRVSPGEEVLVETHDRFVSWQEAGKAPDLSSPALMGVTGAIYVEGARPGSTLRVDILNIQLTSSFGLVNAIPGKGAFANSVEQFTAVRAEIEGEAIHFMGFEIPVSPMVGRAGVAPAGEPVGSVSAGPHGGNLDAKEITTGSSVLLPVFVEGGLLALGDIHAAMGDGEVMISGVETMANVTIRCSVLENWPLQHPMVITPTRLIALASAATLDEASVLALESMRSHVCSRLGLDTVSAGMLLSVAADLGVAQIVNPLKTAKVSLPLRILQS